MSPAPPDVPTLSKLAVSEFVAAVGGCYEKSPWVAERAHGVGPCDSLTALAAAMRSTVDTASEAEKLALLNAHPDLAGKAAIAGELTAESTDEQKLAGLGTLTVEEMARFTELNDAYKARFGFPFILAVRNANKGVILASFARRVHNSPAAELTEAVAQVRQSRWSLSETLNVGQTPCRAPRPVSSALADNSYHRGRLLSRMALPVRIHHLYING